MKRKFCFLLLCICLPFAYDIKAETNGEPVSLHFEVERIIKIELSTDVSGYGQGQYPRLNYTALGYNDIYSITERLNDFNLFYDGKHRLADDTAFYYIDIYYNDGTVQQYSVIDYGMYNPFFDEITGEEYVIAHRELYDFIEFVKDLETQKSNLAICTLVVNPE